MLSSIHTHLRLQVTRLVGRTSWRILNKIITAHIALFLFIPNGSAHLMPDKHGTIKIQGRLVYTTLSLPIEVLKGVDEDQDNYLSFKEFEAHKEKLKQQMDSQLNLFYSGVKGETKLVSLIFSPTHANHEKSTHLIVLKKVEFNEVPDKITLKATLWESTSDFSIVVKAIDGNKNEFANLSKEASALSFFE